MTSAFNDIISKLNWKLNELNLHLQTAREESSSLKNQLKEIEQKISHPPITSLAIDPELEINRLNFIIQHEEKKHVLLINLNNYHDLEKKLEEKLHRAKKELRMLEQYLEAEKQRELKKMKKLQKQALEECAQQQNHHESQ